MKNDFYKLVLEQVEEATRYKKAGVELPSQTEELETYVQDPAKYFITFTSDLGTKLKYANMKFDEVKGRKKRKKYPERSGLPWWEKIPGSMKGQKSPAIPKLGINPASTYNTPNGIYSYPLNSEIYRQLRMGQLPFAQDKPHFSIFEIRDGKNIIVIGADGQVEGLGEKEYEDYLEKIISDDFFDKISSSRVTGQKNSRKPADFWQNYNLAVQSSRVQGFSNMKDGFGQEFIKSYLIPTIRMIAQPKRASNYRGGTETDDLYIALDDLLDEEYEGMPENEDTPRINYLDDFEILIENLVEQLFDWNLSNLKSDSSNLKEFGVDMAFKRIVLDSEAWKGLDNEDWLQKLKKIGQESELAMEKEAYPQLETSEVRLLRSMVDTYHDYKEEDPVALLPEKLAAHLISALLRVTRSINGELDGTSTSLKRGKIENFLEIETERKLHPKDTDFVKNVENNALIDTPFGKLWAITRKLSDTDSDPASNNKWARIWRNLGIDGIIDLGRGLIHSSEPSQALFFSKNTIKLVKSFENKSTPDKLRSYGAQQRDQGRLRGKLFAMARRKYGADRLPKEYYEFLHTLPQSPLRVGNMGLENVKKMILRNQNHFPATEEDLKARLEDKNYKRGKSEEGDRLLDGDSLLQLSIGELERVYLLGFLPLLSPEYIGLFSVRLKAYNHWVKVGKRKKELTAEFNKANVKFFNALKSAKEQGNSKAVEIAKGVTSAIQSQLLDSGYSISDTVKKYVIQAQAEGIEAFNLLDLLREMSKIEVLIDAAKALYVETGQSTRDISAVEQKNGGPAAGAAAKGRYNILLDTMNSMIGGDLTDKEALLKVQKRIWPWNPKGSTINTFKDEAAPWITEDSEEEISLYLESKAAASSEKIVMDVEDMADPNVLAPWEKK